MTSYSLTFAALLLASAPAYAELPQAAVVDRQLPAVVVDPSASSCFVWLHQGGVGQAGTGTCVACEDGKSLVITNAHVVEGSSAPCTVINQGKSYQATVTAVARSGGSREPDLALVVVEGVLPPVPIAEQEPSQGERVRLWGFGGRMGTQGPMQKVGQYLGRQFGVSDVHSTIHTISGDSGSGWFNDAGELVAVHWGNNGRAWAVPLQSVRSFVREKSQRLFPRLHAKLSGLKNLAALARSLPKAAEPPTPKTNPSSPKGTTVGECPGGVCESPSQGPTPRTRRGIFFRR